jgi:hypothetical protein
MNYVLNQDEVSLINIVTKNTFSSYLDGIVTKVGEFMMDFNEEPDMSILSSSFNNEIMSYKDRIHSNKRSAQSMS